VAALTRLADRLALTVLELPEGVLDRIHGALLARHEDLRGFDPTAAPLTSCPFHTKHEGTIPMPETPASGSADSIRAWLPEQIAAFLEVDAGGIGPEHKLSDLGMDSIHALSLCGEVDDRYGLEAESTLARDHPTIEALTRFLASERAAG
jgi:acyl carrier protein